jgi:hypothetical protein
VSTVSLQLPLGEAVSPKVELIFEAKAKLSSLGRLEVGKATTVPNRVIPITNDLSMGSIIIVTELLPGE